MARFVSLGVLVGILIVVGILFYQVMATFLLPLFLAALVVVVFEPVHTWLVAHCGQRKHLAAGLATLAVGAVAILPTVLALGLAASEGLALRRTFDARRAQMLIKSIRQRMGLEMPFPERLVTIESLLSAANWDEVGSRRGRAAELVAAINSLVDELPSLDPKLVYFRRETVQTELQGVVSAAQAVEAALDEDESTFKTELAEVSHRFHDFRRDLCGGSIRARAIDLANPSPERIQELWHSVTRELSEAILPVANATTSFVAQLVFAAVIMFVAIFFFFADGSDMTTTVVRLIPLDPRHQYELLEEFKVISRAVVLATLLSALAQGLLTGLGLWFVGMDSVIFLTILAVMFALIPFVGAMTIWVPASLWLLVVEERTWAAIGLAIYGAIIVSQADNVVKPLMLRGRSNVHPLLALLSILGGVQVLGAIGILVGPMLVVFLQTLLKILHRELTAFENQASSESSRPHSYARRKRPPTAVPSSPSMRRSFSGIMRRFVPPQ